MSKKAAKSKPLRGVIDKEPWINELKTIVINDNSWLCNVSMVIETTPYNFEYVEAVKSEYSTSQNPRHKIKFVSDILLATETMESNYKVDVKYSVGYTQLREIALQYCSFEGFSDEIPVPILASLIKYYIYNLKLKNIAEDLVIKEYSQKKQKAKEESLLNIKNIMNGTIKETKLSKSSEKKTKPSQTKSAEPTKKNFTELRKRNEEVLDSISNETDEPFGDPKLFIVLTSFKKTQLPLELLKLQVPLVALIKLHDFCTLLEHNLIEDKLNAKICKGLRRVSINKTIKQISFIDPQDQFSNLKHTLDIFWDDFLNILNNKNNIPFFKDTIFLKFFPKLHEHAGLTKTRILDPVSNEIKKSLYNQFCHLQYDIQDIKRQHANYVNHLIERDVEEHHFYSTDELMSLYFSLVESIPPEIVNIPFILNSILSQVELLVDTTPDRNFANILIDNNKELDDSIKDTTSLRREEMSEQENSLSLKLAQLEITHDLNIDDEIEGVTIVLPEIFIHGDEIGTKAQWWDKIGYVKTITCDVLKCFWDQFLLKNLPLYDDIPSPTGVYNNKIFEMFKNTASITILDKFCEFPCSFNDDTLIVQDKATVFCTDEETDVTMYKRSICNIHHCNCIKLTDLKHYENPSDGYYLGQTYDQHSFCFEEMTSDIMLQNLFNSYLRFSCIDLLQNYFSNKIIIKFHHKTNCCKEEYLMGTLKTKTALRDFYDYIIEEEFYWLNEEELLFDKMINKARYFRKWKALKWIQYLNDRMASRINKICSENIFILKESLKHSLAPDDGISPILSLIEEEIEEKISSIISDAAHFQAFEIDLPNRVQFSEKRQEFILSENSKLQIMWLYRLYKNEFVSLHAEIHGHTLYFFQPTVGKICDYFHLIHQSGMIFDFKKNRIMDDGPEAKPYVKPKAEEKTRKSSDLHLTEDGADIFLKPLMYELKISLPNSLYFELINPQNIQLYFKQHYLMKMCLPSQLKDENFRCYLLNGMILKFMNDETVIIYYPNGEIFKCYLGSPSISSSKEPNTKSKRKERSSTSVNPTIPLISSSSIKSYEQTFTNGRRILVKNGIVVELEPLFVMSHTDILNGLIVSERSDGTRTTYNKVGSMFVDFPDGSRITSIASFASEEVCFETNEMFNENKKETVGVNRHDGHKESEFYLEQSFETTEEESNYFGPMSQAFVVIDTKYFFEHVNFASVIVDTNYENFEIFLPLNVSISVSSEGLYNVNFLGKAEFITEFDKLIFREINSKCFPEFIINLNDTSEKEQNKPNDIKTIYDVIADAVKYIDKEINDDISALDNESSITKSMFRCEDENGNVITVNRLGEIKFDLIDGTDSICKCNKINDDRYFILDTDFNGLEVFSPDVFDLLLKEAENTKNCVFQHIGSDDHNVLLTAKPLLPPENEKWFMPLSSNEIIITNTLPSTYNDEHTSYNPFPKTKLKPLKTSKNAYPDVILVRSINRVNCNIHLQKDTFLQNKKLVDDIILNKSPHLLIEMYQNGSIPYYKADTAVVDFIRNKIIGSLISRVRSRVVKRIEMRKIREYLDILINCIIPPYFESSHGAVHVILLDILLHVILESEGSTRLEKIFTKDLDTLTDAELNLMHDTIAPITVSNFCNCDEKGELCQLRILLLAGRTLHDIFSSMIEVFHAYGMISRKKRELNEEKLMNTKLLIMKLLNMSTENFTEYDATLLHDKLISVVEISLCTCHENTGMCKLKAIILAGIVLNYIFPNVNAVLQACNISINLCLI